VQGAKDHEKEVQIAFWRRAADEGFPDDRARASAQKFRAEFEALDRRLSSVRYLMGEALSVLDIAWFIYAHRLSLGGYPLKRLHPHVDAWREGLAAKPEFAREIVVPPHVRERIEATRREHAAAGKSLEMVAGF
jgi:glutathione S-transferase